MGNEVREKNSPIRGNQVQGLKKCTRRTSGVCNQLLGYVLFIGGLENDKILITFSMVQNLHTRQIAFVLVYPKAKVEGKIFMKFPNVLGLTNKEDSKTHALKFLVIGQLDFLEKSNLT